MLDMSFPLRSHHLSYCLYFVVSFGISRVMRLLKSPAALESKWNLVAFHALVLSAIQSFMASPDVRAWNKLACLALSSPVIMYLSSVNYQTHSVVRTALNSCATDLLPKFAMRAECLQ